MTAGHDLRRADEPVTELDALLNVVVQAVLLVRGARPAGPVDRIQEIQAVDLGQFERLAAAVDAAGIDRGRR